MKNYAKFVEDLILESKLQWSELKKSDDRFKNFIDDLIRNESFQLLKSINNQQNVSITNRLEILKKLKVPIKNGDFLKSPDWNQTELNRLKKNFVKYFYKISGTRFLSQRVLQTSIGWLTLHQLEKTERYGSNKGSGGGTRETRVFESIQLIFIRLYQKSKINPNLGVIWKTLNLCAQNGDVVDEGVINKLYRFGRKVNLPDKILVIKKEQLKFYCNEEEWLKTFVSVSEKIVDEYLDNKKDYIFYHREFTRKVFIPLLNGIVKEIKKIVKINHKFILNDNKWNPCDIWIMNKDKQDEILRYLETISPKLKKYSDYDIGTYRHLLTGSELEEEFQDFLIEFNDVMVKYVENKDLIGVSLKKVLGIPRDKFVNGFDFSFYLFDGFKTLPKKGMEVFFKIENYGKKRKDFVEGSFIFSGAGANTATIEIKGRMAKHGRLSLTAINDILERQGLKPIKDHVKLNRISIGVIQQNCVNIINYLNGDPLQIFSLVKFHETSNILLISKIDWIIKYQGLQLIKILYDNYKTVKTNQILTDAILAALSIRNDWFGDAIPHIKIV